MFDIPTNFFHGHFYYLKIGIFDFGNFSKIREETPGIWFPGKKSSRELPGSHFYDQNHQLNIIGPPVNFHVGTPVVGFLMDALLTAFQMSFRWAISGFRLMITSDTKRDSLKC